MKPISLLTLTQALEALHAAERYTSDSAEQKRVRAECTRAAMALEQALAGITAQVATSLASAQMVAQGQTGETRCQ